MPKTKDGGYIIDENAGMAELNKKIEEAKKKREKDKQGKNNNASDTDRTT
jgi:hypothetical protein